MLVEFYDPHDGIQGAMIPIPSSVKAVLNEIDGKKLEIDDVINKIKTAFGGECEVLNHEDHKFISLKFRDGIEEYPQHSFRAIRYH